MRRLAGSIHRGPLLTALVLGACVPGIDDRSADPGFQDDTVEDSDAPADGEDAADLQFLREDEDTREMYSLLSCGSRNHMRSFYSQLEKRGLSYEPRYISAESLQGIIATPSEACGGS